MATHGLLRSLPSPPGGRPGRAGAPLSAAERERAALPAIRFLNSLAASRGGQLHPSVAGYVGCLLVAVARSLPHDLLGRHLSAAAKRFSISICFSQASASEHEHLPPPPSSPCKHSLPFFASASARWGQSQPPLSGAALPLPPRSGLGRYARLR